MKLFRVLLVLFILSGATATQSLRAGDWPQFLGPDRNGSVPSDEVIATWPKEGPKILWSKSIGQGFSSTAISGKRLILFTREGNSEVIRCLDTETAKELWSYSYPTAYSDDFGFDDGPRSTPCISGDKVFNYGAEGLLSCVDFSTGKKIWSVDDKKDFGAPKGFFGIGCSPLTDGDEVLINIGGRDGSGVVAFEQATGKVKWKSSEDQASYSSPILATLDGKKAALFFTRKNLIALDPADGKSIFQFPWHPTMNASVSSATPLVIGDSIFVSACYGAGAAWLQIKDSKPKVLWSGEDILSNHYATSVYKDGFIYGIHGRTDPGTSPEPSLRCVDVKTGKVQWEETSLGAASVSLAGDHLIIVTEAGELADAAASPSGFKASQRMQALPSHIRSYPAFAHGCLFIRSKDKLFCLETGKFTK